MKVEQVKRLMIELGISPNKQLGQNFLVSELVIERIVSQVRRMSFASVVEIGPGLGSLTEKLLEVANERACPFTLIELDAKLAAYWLGRGLQVHHEDALHVDWQSLQLQKGLLVSNLPYQISSSIVIDRSVFPEGIESMILMFQKEVAQRICARSGSKEYGLLSVIAQSYWKIENLVDAGPKEFYPSPKIASRVLVFSRDQVAANLDPKYLKFVKAAFAQRRKLLWKNIESFSTSFKISGDKVKAILEESGHSTQVRAENLSPAEFIGLFNRLMSYRNIDGN